MSLRLRWRIGLYLRGWRYLAVGRLADALTRWHTREGAALTSRYFYQDGENDE